MPTLTITPIYPRSVLDKWISRLPATAVCVFVSRHAIDCIGPSLGHAPQWPNIRSICLGPGSRQALVEQGIPDRVLISPTSPPYETETLLAHPFFLSRDAKNKEYWIFRGPPGRTLLQDTLKAQGATIKEIALYNRELVTLSPVLRDKWEAALTDHNVTLVSSAEGLENLMTRLKQLKNKALTVRLLEQPLLLPSARVAQLAKSHGFRYITETGSLETQSLLNALKKLFS